MSDVKRTSDSARLWGKEAAQWWTLLHGDGATAADRRVFLSWVSRSPERIEAYLEVERLMTVLRGDSVNWPDTPVDTLIHEAKASAEPTELLSGLSGARSASAASPEKHPSHTVARGARVRRLGFAAVMVVLFGVLASWLWFSGSTQIYRTRAGEQRSILLADGSRVTLNSASSVEVDLGKHRRVIHLLRGEALFQVSHNPARPFDVYADGAVVRAIGTEFNVALARNYATVTVLEGRVAVMSAAQASLPVKRALFASPGGASPSVKPRLVRFPAPAGALLLGVAQRVRITPHGLSRPRPVSDLTATTAWTRRRLVFNHRPLGQVVDELERAGGLHIVIKSAALRARDVTGAIRLDDPNSLLEFLSDVPGVVIRRGAGNTRIVMMRHTSGHT